MNKPPYPDTMSSSLGHLSQADKGALAPPYRIWVYAACTALALLLNYSFGKDLAWDTLNYHVYAGFSALHSRWSQDYFAAGPQSYFNPYAYIPFYWLINLNLSPLAISSVLAAMHSIMLWLIYDLAMTVCPYEGRRSRLLFGLCSIAFACLNPILLLEIGSSFADITTGELVVAAWLLIANVLRAPSKYRLLFAGLLLGAATGMKPTNAVHAISTFALVALLPLGCRSRCGAALLLAAASMLGFFLVVLPWSYALEKMFGNPFFPLLNGVFRSPEFTTESIQHFRFVPADILEALWRPFAMIDPVHMVHTELRSPDVRYALLLMLLVVGAIGWRRRTRDTDPATSRVLTALGLGLALDWTLWLSGSGNSRYFLPMGTLAGVVLAGVIFRLFTARPKVRGYILVALFVVQGTQFIMGTDFRWNPQPWDPHWLTLDIPARLKSEPNLYLSIGAQSNSFIAPFVAPASGFVNFAGGYTVPSSGASGARIQALIARYAPHVRMLMTAEAVFRDSEPRRPHESDVDDALEPLGMRVDPTDCATVAVHGLPPDLEIEIATSSPRHHQSVDTTLLLSCRVVTDRRDHSTQRAERELADLVLNRVEDACPQLFRPRRPQSEHSGHTTLRRYIGTDLTAWISLGWVKYRQPVHGGSLIYLGREDDWARAALPVECSTRDGMFYAKVKSPTSEPGHGP